ncbi:MAG: pantetheine-phosphate adenylyltransferase [Myxococcota bacterium]|nr:pantetheine-phosphate adenylyltransferase [Myxococcota bacterium]
MPTAVVAGSFDPITNGHLDVIRRARLLFDEVVVAAGRNVNKRRMFTLQERLKLIEAAVDGMEGVRVDAFDGLLVDYCRKIGASVIVRGLRPTGDFDFEFQIGLANMDLAPEVESVFILASTDNLFISSSLAKEIATHGGDVSRYLPAAAHTALLEKLSEGGAGA